MKHPFLRRYTDLPSLIYLLSKRTLTLLDPSAWLDKNDSRYMQMYKEKGGLASVLALCFTQATETFHHWQVYAYGRAGVCIHFRRQDLLAAVKSHIRVRAGNVRYRRLADLRVTKLARGDLPFLKRLAFKDEREFRIVYGTDTQIRNLDVPIPLDSIERVMLSPQMDSSLAPPAKHLLKSIDGCADLKIQHSTLLSNREWLKHGASAV